MMIADCGSIIEHGRHPYTNSDLMVDICTGELVSRRVEDLAREPYKL